AGTGGVGHSHGRELCPTAAHGQVDTRDLRRTLDRGARTAGIGAGDRAPRRNATRRRSNSYSTYDPSSLPRQFSRQEGPGIGHAVPCRLARFFHSNRRTGTSLRALSIDRQHSGAERARHLVWTEGAENSPTDGSLRPSLPDYLPLSKDTPG